MKLETNKYGVIVVVRSKDSKELGTVENGEFKAHAPVYYKEPVISEIKALIEGDEGDGYADVDILQLEETIEHLKEDKKQLMRKVARLEKELAAAPETKGAAKKKAIEWEYVPELGKYRQKITN